MGRLVSRLLILLLLSFVLSCNGQTVREKVDADQVSPGPVSDESDPRSPVPDPQSLFLNPQSPFISPHSLPQPVLRNGPHFAVIPENPRPGDPVTVVYADSFFGGTNFEAVLLDSRGRRQARAVFFSLNTDDTGREMKAALLAVPSTVPVQNMVLRVETSGRIVQELPLSLADRDFRSERIALDDRNTEIRAAPNPQRVVEAEQLWAILSRTGSDVYATGSFIPPVSSTRRTSLFGTRRVYEYVDGSTDTSIHAGVDIGVPTGTQVLVCARGKVVLARSRIVSGNTVIVEHAPGVYSLYYHMDSLSVEEGAFVEAGTLVGLSGSTGLSTGPHLHWEIRVAGENTDPDAFVDRPLLDKEQILSKLTGYGD